MRKFKSFHQGMTFIEVLISLVILATGIIGAVAMQTAAKQGSFDAMQRSLASALAQDIIERIRANDADAAIIGSYAGTYSAALTEPSKRCNTTATVCTPAEMTANDLYEWTQLLIGADVKSGTDNVGGLSNGLACIITAGQVVTIVITWKGRAETQDASDGTCGTGTDKNRRQFNMTSFLF